MKQSTLIIDLDHNSKYIWRYVVIGSMFSFHNFEKKIKN